MPLNDQEEARQDFSFPLLKNKHIKSRITDDKLMKFHVKDRYVILKTICMLHDTSLKMISMIGSTHRQIDSQTDRQTDRQVYKNNANFTT